MTMHGSYDSPTFLGQKDKYLLGLSLPQLMVAMGVAIGWFLVTLSFPLSVLVRSLLLVPLTGVSLALVFARISGLSIPMFILLSIKSIFSKPSYEEKSLQVLEGDPVWVTLQQQKAENPGGFFSKLRGRQKSAMHSLEAQEKQAELRAEVDKQVVESSVATEQWVRDGIRTLMKGQ